MGIVAKLSECIASRGGNILGADVFVPENKTVFYSRRSLYWFLSLIYSEHVSFSFIYIYVIFICLLNDSGFFL